MKLLIDLPRMTKAQREFAAGVILNFPQTAVEEIDNGGDGFNEPLTASTLEPSPEAAFGTTIPPAPPAAIAATGPHLVIPTQSAIALLDKSGLPWDARIHSSNKAFNADGSWRARRGIDDAVKSQVEIELRQVMAIPKPPTTATPPAPPVSPTLAAVPESIAAASPIVPAVTATPAVDDAQPYYALINRCSELMSSGKAQREEIQAICLAVGLPSLALLGSRKDLVPEIAAAVEQLVAGK